MVVSPPPADISLRTVGRTRRRRFRVVMFKKKRNNIRAREKVAEEGDDADEPGVLSTVNDKDKKPKGGTAARKKAAKKEGAASTGGAALLSFEDEEADAEVFQLKKQKHRSKTSMRAPDASRRDDDADVRANPAGSTLWIACGSSRSRRRGSTHAPPNTWIRTLPLQSSFVAP